MNAESPQNHRPRGFVGRVVDAVVAPVVQPVVNAVDVEGVVDRVDVEAVIDRIDVDALVDRIDVDKLVDRLDVAGLVERVDLDEVLQRLDLDALLARVDLDAVLARVDADALLARVDADALLDRVDPNRLLDRVEPNRLLDRVDPNALLDRVEPDRLLDRVDANRLLDRVDPDRLLDRVGPDRLLDRVDPNRLLERVDANALVDRVDLDAVMARVDVNELVRRTELGDIIARSTTGVFGQVVDLARSYVMVVDLVVQGLGGRLARRRDPELQRRPDAATTLDVRRAARYDRATALQGFYAGSVSRFLAFVLDVAVSGVVFSGAVWLLSFALSVVTNITWDAADAPPVLAAIVYFSWMFLYLAVPIAATGRTVGMTVLGIGVRTQAGGDVDFRRAALRTVVFPLSFLLFGIGLLIGLLRADRRELHDLIAGTCVIYQWDADLARRRAVASQDAEAAPDAPRATAGPGSPGPTSAGPPPTG